MKQLQTSLSLFLLISLAGKCIVTAEEPRVLEATEIQKLNDEALAQIKIVFNSILQAGIQIDKKLLMATSNFPAKIRENSYINEKLDQLDNIFVKIDSLSNSIVEIKQGGSIDQKTANEMINRISESEFDSLFRTRQLHWIVLEARNGNSNRNFLAEINHELQKQANILCDDTLSPQQHLFDFYSNIIVTETRAIILNISVYYLKTMINRRTNQFSIKPEVQSFLNRMNEYKEAIRQELEKASRDIHRCEPTKHERGNTFIEFEKAQQPYIFNEDQYQPREQCSSCRKRVSEIGNQLTFQTGNTVGPVEEVQYPVSRPCNGTVHSCDKFGNFFQYGGEVCLLPEDSIKRYGWIKSYSSSVTYGANNQCNGQVIKPLYKHTWKEKKGGSRFYYSPNLYYCHYCLCICDEHHLSKSLRAINIRGLSTDTAENMVVTGIRLVEHNRVIHIQMKQGKLLPGGKIDSNSESWMPLEDRNIKSMIMNQDYVFINDIDFNMVLEDMMADKNTAICGVKFQAVYQNQFKGIKLQIASVPFNWTSGTMESECQWKLDHSSGLVEQASNNLNVIKKMENLDDPLRSRGNVQDLKNTIIKFSMSDMVKDAGQSMVPFLDALPVETKPAAPLGGVGLFHKGTPGFGGFVSPRIYNVDLTDYTKLF